MKNTWTSLCCYLALCCCLTTCLPPRHREKRSTIGDVFGDLTAVKEGIINEKYLPDANCKEIYDRGLNESGLYRINLNDGKGEFTVFCEMTVQGGGWTVIQRRVDATVNFNRVRKDYVSGFGAFNGNFWLGLEKIKRLIDYDSDTYELYIGLESFFSSAEWSKYGSFSLGTDAEDYKLSISQYDVLSPAGDGLTDHNGQKFSTSDKDVDSSSSHCAQVYSAGWWYNNCHKSHLNGIYHPTATHPTSYHDGIVWQPWQGVEVSLKSAVMAIRPASS